MTSIDEVIARSRQPGGFSEHRTFTLARDRAIEKMRQFALADPHYYILELIQSAIANNATFIDITLEEPQVILTYVGGHYVKRELEELFDFLFASNANVEQGSLRLLALGVNALMLFEPDEIILESGDGTLAGTTRVVINRGKGVVEVGTPDCALHGTFMRATGLKRRGMNKRSALEPIGGRQREYTAIEERCIVAPVPVIVNGEPIFGYSSQRSPSLFGFSHTIRFDEGDLYGTIGLASRKSSAVFRLVTHGVWTQTVGHDFTERLNTGYEEPFLGGVISFGPLRKTADHSGIVKDAVYDLMWQRLLPYLEQLRFGTQAQRMGNILLADGTSASPADVISLVREAKGVVLVPAKAFVVNARAVEHARRVGEALLFPVLGVDEGQESFVRSVAGNEWPVVTPNWDTPDEVLFYETPESELPARPWLLEPIDCQSLNLDEINAFIESSGMGNLYGANVEELRRRFWGGTRSVKTTLYTQFDPEQGEFDEGDDKAWADLRVWIQVCGRLVQEVRLTTFFPGQVLVVEIPDIQPGRLRQSVHRKEPTMAVMIAQAVSLMLSATLDQSVREAIQGLSTMAVAPGSLGARWIVAGLAHSTMTRLNAEPEQDATMSLMLLDRTLNPALLDVPVLETLAGESISVGHLARMIQDGCGLVYGVIPEVEADLTGLDRSKILKLDLHLERLIVELLGESTYVRVDGRDVLAEYRGVRCRDIALGLRKYADFPLLVEGGDPTGWPEAEQRICVLELLKQLREQFGSAGDDFPSENRRQALRHLQWFAVHREQYPLVTAITYVDGEPLFLTSDDLSAPYSVVRGAQQGAGNLRMFDGLARDIISNNAMFNMPRQVVASDVAQVDLAMNPYVFWLLRTRGEITGLTTPGLLNVDADAIGEQGRGEQTDYLDRTELNDERFGGVLKIPFRGSPGVQVAGESAQGAVLVVSHDRQKVFALEEAFYAFGVVGFVKLHTPAMEDGTQLADAVMEASRELLNKQVQRVASGALTEGAVYEQVVLYLLWYAGQHLQLFVQSDGWTGARVVDVMANRILELPLFSAKHGSPVSIRRLFYAFRNALFMNPDAAFEDLQWASELIEMEDISEPLKEWLKTHFHPGRVRRVAERRRVAVAEPVRTIVDVQGAGETNQEDALLASLSHWLQELRPDSGFTAGAAGTQDLPLRLLFGELPIMKPRRGSKAETLLALDMPSQWLALERNLEDGSVYPGMTVWMNSKHWMIQWALAMGEEDSRPLAWLLLAVYAHINEALEAVKNVDEQVFQQRVYETLNEKKLKWVV